MRHANRRVLGGLLLVAAVATAAAAGGGGCAGPTSRPVTDADGRQNEILAHPDAYGGAGGRSIFGTDDRDTVGHDVHSILDP